MGTRNLTMVFLDGEFKVAQYGQYDGYPSGQGATVLEFLRRICAAKPMLTPALDKFKKRVRALGEHDETSDGLLLSEHPELDRSTAADVLELIHKGKVRKVHRQVSFIGDSLFCEWAYLVDLDSGVLEVYKGFNKKPNGPKHRFPTKDYQYIPEHRKDQPLEYHPCRKVAEWKLTELPELAEFIDKLEHPYRRKKRE